MADAQTPAPEEIRDQMPVVGSDGRHIGTVDRIEGEFIKLTKTDPESRGKHRYLPLSTVAGVGGGVVRLSMPARKARETMESEASMAEKRALHLDEAARQEPGGHDDAPHGSRAHAHGGPKGQREHGQSGQASGPPGQTSFGVHRPVDGDPGPDGRPPSGGA